MTKTSEARKDEQEQQQEEKALAIWDLGSPLYDSYELVSLTHLIERHLMTLPSLGGSKRLSSTKKISPASDHDHDLLVIPAAIFVSNMGTKRETKRVGSSVLNTLSEFVRRKLWIKRKIGSYSKKGKSKKLKAAGHSCIRFGL
ncbi:unnamed protein product [Dovyalis caffra]|uniref:Uncharacterized protein n=1 Tax=Dovyalis caffra TaxID=77055 RepID=A0AAV1SEZ3_9ROSI|nr:unnamed protein product [Dovyalis caffra]